MTTGTGGTSRRAWPGRRAPRTGRVRLEDALCLVTGAGNGIGRHTALALASRGAKVLVVDIDGPAAKQAAADCGGLPYELDVSDRRAVADLADAIHAEHGPLDVLVNNAGVGMSGRFADATLEDWDWILGVNLLGVIHCSKIFGTRMLERGRGHVVNVSSGLGYFPTATESAYCTTKAAVIALSRSLRADWAEDGVGVSVVCPGVIATGIIERTRFLGAASDPEAVTGVRQMFARRGHPPTLVADAIVDAVEHDRPVVPVGAEARVGWALRGLVPSRVGDRLALLSARARNGGL